MDDEARRDKVIADLISAVGAARSDFKSQADVYERALRSVGDLERKSADMGRDIDRLMSAVENLSRKFGRPIGADGNGHSERESAIALLEQKHALRVTKADPAAPPVTFSEAEIDEAMLANKAFRSLL